MIEHLDGVSEAVNGLPFDAKVLHSPLQGRGPEQEIEITILGVQSFTGPTSTWNGKRAQNLFATPILLLLSIACQRRDHRQLQVPAQFAR